MSNVRFQRVAVLFASCSILVLAGCASPANRDAMSVQKPTVTKKFPQSVSVTVSGGNETGAMDSPGISNADLKAAIESSIQQSSLFKDVIQGKGGNFELNVMVTNLTKPMFGFNMTVEMEAGWSLANAGDKSVVFRKSIKSTFTATTSDAFVGATRLRMAVEGAARENIGQGLAAIAALNL